MRTHEGLGFRGAQVALIALCCLSLGGWGFMAAEEPATAQEQSAQEGTQSQPQEQQSATAPASPEQPTLGARAGSRKSDRGTSLAAVAGMIKLDRSAAGSGFVVTNQNLSEVAGKGRISVGTEAGASGSAERSAAGESEPSFRLGKTPEEQWREQLGEQQKKVEQMQQDREAFEQKVRENRGPYSGVGPQNQAPGVVSGNQLTREQADATIAAERLRLQQLQRQGKRQGYNPEAPPENM